MKNRQRTGTDGKRPRFSKSEWQRQKIAEAHAKRASDPVKQARIDAQALDLLRERVTTFGTDWHVGCAIRLPAAVQEAIAWHGTDFLLSMLDEPAAI